MEIRTRTHMGFLLSVLYSISAVSFFVFMLAFRSVLKVLEGLRNVIPARL